jgi:hypothetical protein
MASSIRSPWGQEGAFTLSALWLGAGRPFVLRDEVGHPVFTAVHLTRQEPVMQVVRDNFGRELAKPNAMTTTWTCLSPSRRRR